ncbi:MAG: rhodanese-like domain-containing protein [Desulfobulbaceae bacterium]|jgi:rhodanese-related sulfurtransferase/rubrerythrin|nr:rhodanese-like domain-containing protein [Desulfobulbaceae bacterium]
MQLDEYYNLTVDEFYRYQDEHHEDKYVLVDVRFPEEYEDEHIPGSRLIPLSEIIQRITELPVDCDIIFYCNSGRRSRAAALFATSVPFFQNKVYHVTGGILTYFGRTLPDYPALAVLDLDTPMENLLYSAMNLERGTALFYNAVLDRTGTTPFRTTMEELARAEESHARLLYNFWKKDQAAAPPFAEVYSALPGDIVEGGKGLEEQLDRLDGLQESVPQTLLDMILDLEYGAYDLYRAVAEKVRGSDMEEPFLSLAQAEKHHIRLVAETFSTFQPQP